MDSKQQLSFEQLEALITVGEVAELFDVPARIVRAAAKKGEIPGMVSVLGKFGFDPEVVTTWTPPEAGERRSASRREDGRKRYRIYLLPEEMEGLVTSGFEIIDPSEAAKKRRQARKAAKAAVTAGEGTDVADAPEAVEGDPFADFGG